MTNDTIALVTGGNQGIGLQIAKDLAGAGLQVVVGARDVAKGNLAADQVGRGARAVQLDVTDHGSINAASDWIGHTYGKLDVLVNNAGISKPVGRDARLEQTARSSRFGKAELADIREIWETNVFGVIAVTQAMLPLLRLGSAARVVNVSSITGSLSWSTAQDNPYREMFGAYAASKAALNAVTVGFALELEREGITVNAACPGFTKTNLNGFRGTGSVEDGAREPVRLALADSDGPTGEFSNAEGKIRW